MMDMRFCPEEIRELGSTYARHAVGAVDRAQAIGRAAQPLVLPAFLRDSEVGINGLLATVPDSLTFLGTMALNFRRLAHGSADRYEEIESANRDAATELERTAAL